MVKTCSSCKETKPFDLFRCLSRSKDGRTGRCKTCIGIKEKQHNAGLSDETRNRRRDQVLAWKAKNPEKVNKARRDYYARNKEAVLARIKKWREENKAHVSETSRKWREENKEYFYAKVEAWRLQNMERVAANNREWAKNNSTKVKEWTKKWRSENPDKVKAMSKRAQVKRVENLTDKYIKDLFKKQVGVASIEVPPTMIAAKRHYLTIKRKLEKLNEEHN
jgi:hypothetical protein